MAFDFLVLFGIIGVIAGTAAGYAAHEFIRDGRTALAAAARSLSEMTALREATMTELAAMRARAAEEITESKRIASTDAAETRAEVARFLDSNLADTIERVVSKALRTTLLTTRPASNQEIAENRPKPELCQMCRRPVSLESSDSCPRCRAFFAD